jgi:ATP-dependent Clp protease adaptor protein ClpS
MLASMTSTVELPTTRGPGDGLDERWRVIVRNDNHNTFDHVARTLARFIPGVSLDGGYTIADKIHNSGQALVWGGPREPAELYWDQLKGEGLTMAPLEQG